MANVSSIWAHGKGYFLDLHIADVRFALLTGLQKNWALEVAVNERRVVNAHLDNVTVAFHDLFGLDQNGRKEVPMNDTRIQFPDYGIDLGTEFRGAFSRALEATLIKKLSGPKQGRPAVAMSLTLRYEAMEDGPLPQGSLDYSFEFNFGKRLGRSFVYGSLGYTVFDSDRFLTLPLNDKQVTGMLAYEWRTHVDEAVVIQYLFGEGVVKLDELAQPSHEVILGYKWLRGKKLWELALTENVINFENSPDFGITAALSYRF